MKFGLISAALLALGTSQYVAGGAGSVNGPTTGDSSSTTTTTTGNLGDKVVVPSFPAADLLSLQGGSTNSQVTNANQNRSIRTAQTELSTPVRSTESLFTRLPSKGELDKLADDGDVAGIQKTLQVLASDDSIPCGTKVSYLLDVLGTVKAAIQRKNLAADELQAIIDGAKAEIKRLQGEIDRVQKARDALGLPDLVKRVNDLVGQLQVFYDKINAVKAQIPPQEARIAGYLKEIDILSKQNDETRNKISNDNLKLTQTNNLIKDLENRLQEAKDLQTNLAASIAASQAIINDNNTKIANIRNTIDEINAKIRNLRDTLDALNKSANTLEVDVSRARTDLSVAQAKDKTYADQIKDFQNQINVQTPKLVDDDLKKLRVLIDNLNNTIPQIQNQINREYYYCYGAGKVDTVTTGSVIVYVVKGEAFGHYIQNAYGQTVSAPTVVSGIDYRLQVVDPFSRIWTAKYGYPLANGARTAGTGSGSFSCQGGNSGSSGWGTISSVSNDGFWVNDASGKSVKLSVGTCSRVESTSQLPKAGQNVAWRGVPSSAGGYNIYSATCWN